MNPWDTIQEAGRQKKLIRMTYRKLSGEVTERTVEPYSIRNGDRLYAYDIEKQDGIRQFIISGILSAEIVDQEFQERNGWVVEF